jgi:predicted dehydrogenase
MIEKPLTLSMQSAERIMQAEKQAKGGARVFVGYMRRYAPSFVNAFKREVAGIDKILYARSRDIVGPNAYFVGQSGASARKFTDFPADAGARRKELLDGLLQEAFPGQEVTKERSDFCRFLGSLGSHDLSLMRETLGFPESVTGISVNEPFYTASFHYQKDGHKFAVTYESGIDCVPRFDAHLTVYGMNKTVSIQYDTPYIKGLPIKVTVDAENEHGEVVRTEYTSSYEDAYTAEMKELHACIAEGKQIKTTAADASEDLRLFKMMFEQYDKQQGQ